VRIRRAPAVALLSAALSATAIAQSAPTPQDAKRFQSKLTRIVLYGNAAPRTAPGQTTQITDAEVNAYFRYDGAPEVPVGIAAPTLTAEGNGRITGRAIVDLDAVRAQKARGWTDLLGYLSGKLPVVATGTLSTSNGTGRFTLESAQVSGVPIPKSFLQELLSYYSRSPEHPNGINMDDPFELPARIRNIKVDAGTATIVQ
jgi:hypothetical protein